MKRTSLSILMGVLALVWAAGCGGGSGGSGSGGGGSGGSAGGSTSTSSSTMDPQAMCDALCAAGDKAGCLSGGGVPECVTGCMGNYDAYPDCTDQFSTLYQCAIDKVATEGCDLQQACANESMAVVECTSGGCGAGTCSSDGTTCSCEADCNGAATKVDCTDNGTTIDCTCTVDGAEVGTCTGTDLSCGIQDGCCAEFF